MPLLFSVVVPTYNVEKYLEECVASVRNQTYPHWELLLVDDGSTDATREISKRLAEPDTRIRCFAQAHKGAASARNTGIEASVGEYIFFLDSDDVIHPMLLEEMCAQISRQPRPDLLTCNYRCVREMGQAAEDDQRPVWQIVEPDDAAAFFHGNYKLMQGTPSKTVRRVALGDLRFDESLAAVEDCWLIYSLVKKKVRIAYTRAQWYDYRLHPGSITQSMDMEKSVATIEVRKRMCRREAADGNHQWVLQWESILLGEMRNFFVIARRQRNRPWTRSLKREYIRTIVPSPMQRAKSFYDRLSWAVFFLAAPLYSVLSQIIKKIKQQV